MCSVCLHQTSQTMIWAQKHEKTQDSFNVNANPASVQLKCESVILHKIKIIWIHILSSPGDANSSTPGVNPMLTLIERCDAVDLILELALGLFGSVPVDSLLGVIVTAADNLPSDPGRESAQRGFEEKHSRHVWEQCGFNLWAAAAATRRRPYCRQQRGVMGGGAAPHADWLELMDWFTTTATRKCFTLKKN